MIMLEIFNYSIRIVQQVRIKNISEFRTIPGFKNHASIASKVDAPKRLNNFMIGTKLSKSLVITILLVNCSHLCNNYNGKNYKSNIST